MNWGGLLNESQNSAKIYYQYLRGIRINDNLGMVLYNLFKHNSLDSNPNVLKQMSSPRPVSGVTCSGQISAEWWGQLREPRAASSAVGGRRPPLSLLRNKQLIEESLEEYCVPVEMRKVLSFHTNQVKGLPWPLVNVLQHGMMWDDGQQREEVLPAHLRCSEQSTWAVFVSPSAAAGAS